MVRTYMTDLDYLGLRIRIIKVNEPSYIDRRIV